MIKVVVLSADYPGPDYLYGDVFVHTRLKEYVNYCCVEVIGFNPNISHERDYTYQGIKAFITSDLSLFKQKIQQANPDVIVGHLIIRNYFDFLLSLAKPLVIFVHGYEALSWTRRLFNYDSITSLRYLAGYAFQNTMQTKALKRFINVANTRSDIHFVFVSHWLKNAVEDDVNVKVKNAHVVPNPINTSLFDFRKKTSEQRKKILIIRSFKARNYANDISVDAIMKLSKMPVFNDLTFTIYGEGYLFNRLTKPLKEFDNVILNNVFIENKDIPSVHAQHGIFLSPSRMDTQGVSMCEAMSSGLVPVTSPIGGIPEYVEDGKSGFLASTVDEVVNKILLLYQKPETFIQMSDEASRAINAKCGIEKIISKELEIINAVNVGGKKAVYRQCNRCVLDTKDDPEIIFDNEGICNYCRNYETLEKRYVKTGEEADSELRAIVEKIKERGKGKKYDCIIGLSGGVDSTYLAYQASLLGLRPLAVHFDNGWNSELAVSNIENVVSRLNFDLITYVIDWQEFKDLQLAFLKASVVDIEMITDHAIIATMYKLALEHDISFILSGTNIVTEAILPSNWIHHKGDHVHIRAINKRFGIRPLVKFPLLTTTLKVRSSLKGIRSISLLNLMPYNKAEVKKVITEKLGWRDYGGKHYESIFTRFYQGYILPVKFQIEKRKAHLSNLICSGQITKAEALQELTKPGYEEATRMRDFEFVLKKLGLSESDFMEILNLPIKKHTDYPVEGLIYDRIKILKIVRPFWKMFKKLTQIK